MDEGCSDDNTGTKEACERVQTEGNLPRRFLAGDDREVCGDRRDKADNEDG